jgi:DNA (cytosine-5)-methyltransferase 1
VAINQAPILGSARRRVTPYEAGRLQGFPDRVYDAMLETKQPENQSYKQFGNAVHVGTVQFALAHFVCHHFGTDAAGGGTTLGNLVSLIQECRSLTKAWSKNAPLNEQLEFDIPKMRTAAAESMEPDPVRRRATAIR